MILRMQSSWMIKKNGDDIIEIFSLHKMKKIEIKTKNPFIFIFLTSLRKGIKYPDDFLDSWERYGLKKSVIESLISKLRSFEILIEDNKITIPPLNAIYDRQIRYFRTFENQNFSGEQLNEKLQNRTVLIVGLGGYGSWTTLLCARMGIRNIIGIDFDTVEVTNLHRQILYDQNDLGILKVKACMAKIKESDPELNFIGYPIKINSPEDLYPFMDQVDLVFNPFSYLPMQKALNHPAGIISYAAMIKKKPCLIYGGSWIGPLTIPGQTPCYFCAVKALELDGNIDPELRSQNIQKRAFAPPIAACCSLAISEASRYLSGCDLPQVLNGIIQLDIFSFSSSRFLPLKFNSSCNYCSSCTINNFQETK